MSDWYAEPEQELSQGDIFVAMPSVYVREPLETANTVTCGGGVQHLVRLSAQPQLFGAQDETMLTRGNLGRAVILTHGCEIDKDTRYRLIALVRPIAGLRTHVVEEIRSNSRRRFFHLPPESELYNFEESYIDFRRITTVTGSVLETASRILSMQEHLRESMSEALIVYFTRAEA